MTQKYSYENNATTKMLMTLNYKNKTQNYTLAAIKTS